MTKDLLLIDAERSHSMALGHLPLEMCEALPAGPSPKGLDRTRFRDHISQLALERLRIPQEELEEAAAPPVATTTPKD